MDTLPITYPHTLQRGDVAHVQGPTGPKVAVLKVDDHRTIDGIVWVQTTEDGVSTRWNRLGALELVYRVR